MPVPIKLQVALFTRILNYDEKLANFGGKGYRLLVASGPASGDAAAVAGEFSKAGAEASTVDQYALAGQISGADIVYAMPDADAGRIGRLCAKHGVLSISGVPAHAEAGQVSVSLALKADGRPLIIVNIGQSNKEKRSFSAQFLALTKVIR